MRLRRRSRALLGLAAALAISSAGTVAAVAATSGSDLGAKPVFLVRSDNTVDASVAAAAAARAGAPLLYTSPDALDATTRDYLSRYQPSTVVLVGGAQSLSSTVESSVKVLGFAPLRLAGADRAETAAKLGDLVASLPPATQGPKGDAGPAGPAGTAGPRVRDSSNRPLGAFVGSNSGFVDILTSAGYQAQLHIDGLVTRNDARNGLFYSGTSCTGTPWADTITNYVQPISLNVNYSVSLDAWLQRKPMAATSMTAQSRWAYDSGTDTAACQASSYSSPNGVEVVSLTASTVGVPASVTFPLTVVP